MNYEEILTKSVEAIGRAVEAGSVLAVETAQQYVNYVAMTAICWAAFWTLCVLLFLVGFYAAIRAMLRTKCLEEGWGALLFILLGASVPSYKLNACVDLYLKAKYAPNILVMEKLSEMVKK